MKNFKDIIKGTLTKSNKFDSKQELNLPKNRNDNDDYANMSDGMVP
jgi:hypothetical protein